MDKNKVKGLVKHLVRCVVVMLAVMLFVGAVLVLRSAAVDVASWHFAGVLTWHNVVAFAVGVVGVCLMHCQRKC